MHREIRGGGKGTCNYIYIYTYIVLFFVLINNISGFIQDFYQGGNWMGTYLPCLSEISQVCFSMYFSTCIDCFDFPLVLLSFIWQWFSKCKK